MVSRESRPAVSTPLKFGVGIAALALIVLASARLGSYLGERYFVTAGAAGPDPTLVARYDQWKLAHGQALGALMTLYAPDARIYRITGKVETYNDLRTIAVEVRQNHTFDRVTEVETPRVSVFDGTAEVRALHRYHHSSGLYPDYIGDRRLLWEKRDGQWVVVEDHFPTHYTPVGVRSRPLRNGFRPLR